MTQQKNVDNRRVSRVTTPDVVCFLNEGHDARMHEERVSRASHPSTYLYTRPSRRASSSQEITRRHLLSVIVESERPAKKKKKKTGRTKRGTNPARWRVCSLFLFLWTKAGKTQHAPGWRSPRHPAGGPVKAKRDKGKRRESRVETFDSSVVKRGGGCGRHASGNVRC